MSEAEAILKALRAMDATWPRGHYVRHSEIQAWLAANRPPCTIAQARRLKADLPEPDAAELERLALRFNKSHVARNAQNERWMHEAREQQRERFDAANLTENQRLAIVSDEDVTLVVAGAGTGKTTTIVNKIDYLVRAGLARPHEILVLAYNKEAQLQLQQRIAALEHGNAVRARTFHAFGYGVVRQSTDESLPPLDDNETRSFLFQRLNRMKVLPPDTPAGRAAASFRSDLATVEKQRTFVSNILSFMSRVKTRRVARARLDRVATTPRQRDFLTLYDAISREYAALAQERGAIDFSDMIVRATDLIEVGAQAGRYRYILIDEFQDITAARWRLISALRRQNPQAALFAVGDDWQSIYAFDDADVSIMTGLERKEPGLLRIDLDTTFRFPQRLADLTSAFATRNPGQLKKSITSANESAVEQPVVVHHASRERPSETLLLDLVRQIGEAGDVESLLLLGRYNKSRPENWTELAGTAAGYGMSIQFQTCHAAKGLEADEVIIVDVVSGTMGFPCKLPEDEFMQLLPAPSDPFPEGEERRLFYVALTRTKGRVHLITESGKESPFIAELLGLPRNQQAAPTPKQRTARKLALRLTVEEDHRGRIPHCATCNEPTMIKREGKNGPFWGCSSFPKCWGRPKKCPNCGELAFMLDAPHGKRFCAECGYP